MEPNLAFAEKILTFQANLSPDDQQLFRGMSHEPERFWSSLTNRQMELVLINFVNYRAIPYPSHKPNYANKVRDNITTERFLQWLDSWFESNKKVYEAHELYLKSLSEQRKHLATVNTWPLSTP